VFWSQSGKGSVLLFSYGKGSVTPQSECILSKASCSVRVETFTSGRVTIAASYMGDSNNLPSSGSTSITVEAAASTLIRTATSVSCNPASFASGSNSTCTVTVSGGSSPTGDVYFAEYGTGTLSFYPRNMCTLSSGSCSVTVTGTFVPGTVTIYAFYMGDPNNQISCGRTKVTITSDY
jgi:hypothetical protein